MRRRDERRQVVEPVSVDAPQDREPTTSPIVAKRHLRLQARAARPGIGVSHEEKNEPGDRAEHELLRIAGEVVDREQHGEVARRRRRPRSGASRAGLAAEPQLVPRRDGCQLEERPAAAGMLVCELGLALVPDDLERAAFHRWSSQAPRKTSLRSQ